MIKVRLNGQEKTLSAGMTLSDLLEQYALKQERIAVEIDGVIIDSQDFSTTVLQEANTIEIVRFVGGG